jgi:hypothetical protein
VPLQRAALVNERDLRQAPTKLRFRGLLTESIAKGLLTLAASDARRHPLASVHVNLFDQHNRFIVSLPIAEAIHATAFDTARNEVASWGHASRAEVYILD